MPRLENLTDLDALAVDIHNLTGNAVEQPSLHRAMRLFRRKTCCWYGRLHEQVNVRQVLGRDLRAAPLKGARIDHLGYMAVYLEEHDKLARNLRLAEAALASEPDPGDQEGVPQMNVGRALAAPAATAKPRRTSTKQPPRPRPR